MFHYLFSGVFIAILVYILFLASFKKHDLIEGLESKGAKIQTYEKDPMQIATKNEENIKVLQKDMQDLRKLASKTSELKKSVISNSKNIDGLIKQQKAQVKATGLMK